LGEIIDGFLKKGGRIDKSYLRNPSKGPALVFYKKWWYRGRNVREAISRALAG